MIPAARSARPSRRCPRTGPALRLLNARAASMPAAIWCKGPIAGVPATEVARRAGHSVVVLLKIYAHCIEIMGRCAAQPGARRRPASCAGYESWFGRRQLAMCPASMSCPR